MRVGYEFGRAFLAERGQHGLYIDSEIAQRLIPQFAVLVQCPANHMIECLRAVRNQIMDQLRILARDLVEN